MDDLFDIQSSPLLFTFDLLSIAAVPPNVTNPIVYTAQQKKILRITKASAASTSFTFSLVYIIYVIIRSIISFPYSTCCGREKGEPFNFRNFLNALTTQSYLFARPITRILFCLQVSECFDDSQVLIEIAKLSRFEPLCIYQALVFQYFGLAKLFWELVIAVWMVWILVLQKRTKLIYLEVLSHLVAWGVPVIGTVIPAATRSYGDCGGYCWIQPTKVGNALRYAVNYIPLWLVIALICLLYLITVVHVTRVQILSYRTMEAKRKYGRYSASMKLYIKLLGFPLVFVTLWICPTLYRILEPILKRPMFPLYFLLTLTRYSHGFCNTIVLMLSDVVGNVSDKIRRRTQRVITEQELYDMPEYFSTQKESYEQEWLEGEIEDN